MDGPPVVFNTQVADISRSRVVAAGQQAIWDVLADFGAISSWAPMVDHSSLLHADARPPEQARRVQMGRTTVIEKVVAIDAPTTLAYDIEGLPRIIAGLRNSWELAALPTGFTVVTLTTTVAIGPRAPQQLAERVVCRLAARQSEQLLAGLASLWEDRHAR
ncbi:MxaD family protein [Mycolicibacterium murale]|uniref:MxaD family protein n=1 Tax=Mycolicibacterium murale TaxID=182220 RepID=A0A7I9WKG0_9MYCO|nr:MxaD family protein [Mycolicibacterium murale]